MWVHIVIFALIPLVLLALRRGWIQGMERIGKRGCLLFAGVAAAGNFAGLVLTLQNGADTVYEKEVCLIKEDSGAYEEKFYVSESGKERETVYIQIPQKETEEQEKPQETVSPEEERQRELKAALDAYNSRKNDPDHYYLPTKLDGKKIVWTRPGDTAGTLLAGLGFLAAAVLMGAQTREEQKKLQKRREELLLDYPALVMKFTLLVQAGMTARRAFQKIGEDYLRRKKLRTRCAYEEIVTACREMESGVSELDAYRRFGERCSQVQYKIFSTLLIQNLQKGSRQLSDMLERESLAAWEERKRKARVLGEAAATKLLFPMVLMLLVVMVIIMIPAFLSFYGGT